MQLECYYDIVNCLMRTKTTNGDSTSKFKIRVKEKRLIIHWKEHLKTTSDVTWVLLKCVRI
jgi:hypothetical protein